jgi:hypothetical protein
MKTLIITAACAAAFIASSLPCAAADISGQIGNIDVLSRTVTLTNGQTYRLPQSAKPESFKIGDGVAIDFNADSNGLLVARAITLNSRLWFWKPQSTSATVGA